MPNADRLESRRDAATDEAGAADLRRPYVPPVLEHVGSWSVLTLQQSVPVGLFHAARLNRARDV